MGIFDKMKTWGHGQQKLSQLDNPDPKLRALVIESLQFCLLQKGIELNERRLRSALKYGKTLDWTVKEYVDLVSDVHEYSSSAELSDPDHDELENALGIASEDIIALGELEGDLQFVMHATSTITVILAEAKREFNLEIKQHSLFQEWLNALASDDMATISELSRYMETTLRGISSIRERGQLLLSWSKDMPLR